MDQYKWHSLSTIEQLGNIGAEVGRAITWRANPTFGNSSDSFKRSLEYLSLSIDDPKLTINRLRELCRVRELLIDWYYGFGHYNTTDNDWTRYFDQFGIAANNERRKNQG